MTLASPTDEPVNPRKPAHAGVAARSTEPARAPDAAGQTATEPVAEPADPSEASETPAKFTSRIRSFATRRGHLTPGQRSAIDSLSESLCLPLRDEPLDFAAVFGNQNPVTLEIGCGMGETTARIAADNPGHNYIGVEVYSAGVGTLLRRIEEQSLDNLRVIQADAVEVLERMISPASLAGTNIFFPDPWHKKRHHKRRLIQAPFVALLASRLAPGARLHCATDWPDYAEQMLAVLGAEPTLRNSVEDYHPRPSWRPLTKFEQRGLRLGHPVFDLIFERIRAD